MPKSPRPGRALAVALALAAVVAGCGRLADPRPNILLIVIDTLRADRLGAYGHPGGLTPFIDGLAAEATVFENAYAQSSWTNPSVASLFTSRLQSQHGIVSFGSHLRPEETTLAEVLAHAGYVTAGFSANVLVNPQLGFDQGFIHYGSYAKPSGDDTPGLKLVKARAARLNAEVLDWLTRVEETGHGRSPQLVYLHYMEPHTPYDPPEHALARVFGDGPRPDPDRLYKDMMPPTTTFEEEQVRDAERLYDAELIDLDLELGRLFAELEGRGFLEDAVVVLVSDHGEEFLEHGMVGHHQTLYEEVIRVPLLVRLPGQAGGKRVEQVVALTDVAPTLLELAGIPVPPSFEGVSLLGAMAAAEPGPPPGDPGARRWADGDGERLVVSELIKPSGIWRTSPHERAVVGPGAKLIVGLDDARERFDLRADPGERNPQAPLASAGPRLEAALRELGPAPAADEPAPPLDPETLEQMRALGYVE